MENRRIGFRTDALLAPEQALTLYFAHAQLRSPQTEYVQLDHALRRVLAEPIVSDAAYPAAPRSAMDGFAVRSADTPGRLHVAGEIRMGHAWTGVLAEKSALRIPTGGVLPEGADAVVPIEDADCSGESVEVAAAVPAGDCVTPSGSDMRAGETLLEPGRRIGGAELGVLATLGIASVAVYRRPVIGVISSGDELVELTAQPTAAQVRDSNRWAVAGTLEALGAAVRHLPTAPDDPARLEALLREAVATCEGVVLTGGSSVGERDFTPRIIAQLGSPGVIVHGLRVKPGKPTVLACVDGKPVVGLPGNPASALMILEAVAAPIVSALAGRAALPVVQVARLGAAVRKRSGWTWFVPVKVDEAEGARIAYPLELRSSSVSLLGRASGFLVLDETIETVPAGAPVDVTRFLVGGY
ncbi:MAG TPA: molybdopterin molybdotransferase MoeA [Candidatus Baltobacteraceae bacterium]|nr:molybdopterin molybdotransferase MoeA [Candidatus Baltobacteraceae bacterium]